MTNPPVVTPETPRDHTANALTILSTYRQANGGNWYRALNNPGLDISELAEALIKTEARLSLALKP